MARLIEAAPLLAGCTAIALVGAGFALIPANAENAPKSERKIVIRTDKQSAHEAASLTGRLAALREKLADRSRKLEAAGQRLDDAEQALQQGDETAAQALLKQAKELLGSHLMASLGGDIAPMALEDLDITIDLDHFPGAWFHGAEGENVRKLVISIEDGRMIAEGEDAAGTPFRYEGSPAEVREQLRAAGITPPTIAGMKAPASGKLKGAFPGWEEKEELMITIPHAPVPPHFPPRGQMGLSPEAAQELTAELQRLSRTAAEQFARGEQEAGLETLQEAFQKSMRLRLQELLEEGRTAHGAGIPFLRQLEIEAELQELAEAPDAGGTPRLEE